MKIIRSAVGSVASLGLIKFLNSVDFSVVGTDISDGSVGKFLTEEIFIVPKANLSNEQELIDAYNSIIEKTNASWILSGPEEEIEILIKNKSKIKTNIFHLPYETFLLVSNKQELYKNMMKYGIQTPRIYEDFIHKENNSKKYILKPKKGRGSVGVFTVFENNVKQKLKELDLENYLLQDFIEGKEISVDTLHDFSGNLLNAIPRERIKVESGISIVSKTFFDEKLLEIVEKISKNFVFSGFNCLQFFKEKQTGDYYITDINPRFGGGAILSLHSSDSMKNNFISLLRGTYTFEGKFVNDYKELTMYRGYEEFYQ